MHGQSCVPNFPEGIIMNDRPTCMAGVYEALSAVSENLDEIRADLIAMVQQQAEAFAKFTECVRNCSDISLEDRELLLADTELLAASIANNNRHVLAVLP